MWARYRGEWLMLGVAMIGASGWFFSKYALAGMPPIGFMGVRFLLACLIFLPFAYREMRRLRAHDIWRAMALGGVQLVNLFLWIVALSFGSDLGEGAFLMSLAMLMAPLLAWGIFFERPPRIFWAAMPVALCGLYLLSGQQGGFSLSTGSLLFLMTSMTSALFFVLNNRYAREIPVFPLVCLQFLVVGVGGTAYTLLFERWTFPISANVWGWFVISVLIATNVRYFLQTAGQKACSIGSAAIIMLLEPVGTLLLSVALMGEALPTRKLTGCMLIFAALLLYRLPLMVRFARL